MTATTTAAARPLHRPRRSGTVLKGAWIIMAIAGAPRAAGAAYICNHTVWTDTQGDPIDCHEGGILRVGDTFYWHGRSYEGNVNGVYGTGGAQYRCGLNVYSSTDLVNWTFRGECLSYPESGWLTEGTWHRPRVLYEDQTGKYVLWFFFLGASYPCPLVVATADSPTGPFTILGPPTSAETGGDLALFEDQDGAGYLAYDTDNRSIRVSRLAADFLSTTGATALAMSSGPDGPHEGTSMARYKGRYIVAGSGVAGLNPTDTSYAVADAPLGPYDFKGSMSDQRTWDSQISSFFYLAESDRLIAICEQWLTGPSGETVPADESCQLWLPVSFDPAAGVARMQHLNRWDPWVGEAPPPPPGSMVGYWALDEMNGIFAADQTGNGNDVKLVNGPTWTGGRFSGGLSFDGVDDYLSAGVNGMPPPDSPQTHAFWLFYESVPASAQACADLSNFGAHSGVFSGFQNLAGSGWALGTWKYGGPFLVSTPPPAAGEWHHYAYTFDGETHTLYVDGAEAATSETTPQSAPPNALAFGASHTGVEAFAGKLDDIRIYNYALDADEVMALAQGNAGDETRDDPRNDGGRSGCAPGSSGGRSWLATVLGLLSALVHARVPHHRRHLPAHPQRRRLRRV